MLASRSVAEGRNGAFGGVQPAAKRRAAKLQTEAQREWRFDEPSVTSATAMKRCVDYGTADTPEERVSSSHGAGSCEKLKISFPDGPQNSFGKRRKIVRFWPLWDGCEM